MIPTSLLPLPPFHHLSLFPSSSPRTPSLIPPSPLISPLSLNTPHIGTHPSLTSSNSTCFTVSVFPLLSFRFSFLSICFLSFHPRSVSSPVSHFANTPFLTVLLLPSLFLLLHLHSILSPPRVISIHPLGSCYVIYACLKVWSVILRTDTWFTRWRNILMTFTCYCKKWWRSIAE